MCRKYGFSQICQHNNEVVHMFIKTGMSAWQVTNWCDCIAIPIRNFLNLATDKFLHIIYIFLKNIIKN